MEPQFKEIQLRTLTYAFQVMKNQLVDLENAILNTSTMDRTKDLLNEYFICRLAIRELQTQIDAINKLNKLHYENRKNNP